MQTVKNICTRSLTGYFNEHIDKTPSFRSISKATFLKKIQQLHARLNPSENESIPKKLKSLKVLNPTTRNTSESQVPF